MGGPLTLGSAGAFTGPLGLLSDFNIVHSMFSVFGFAYTDRGSLSDGVLDLRTHSAPLTAAGVDIPTPSCDWQAGRCSAPSWCVLGRAPYPGCSKMAASMLNRVCMTLRTPGLCGVAPGRLRHYTNEPAVSGKVPARRGQRFPQRRSRTVYAPRTERMLPDQDWTSVYPTAASFKPSAVPLPVRMGNPLRRGAPPDKYGNLELMKVPNFLHLTPLAIKKHCAVLKEFCTEWPAALSDDDQCKQHFPIELKSMDYVFAGPSIRNPEARVVTLQIKLSSLNLDQHARKKLIKLAGSRYNAERDTLTIQTDRCPLRMQNEDYAMYLLTVLYHESCKTEAWESERDEGEMDEYIWEGSMSEKNALQTLSKSCGTSSEEILQSASVQEYRSAMLNLRNEGETEDNIGTYKESVKKMLSIA